ncbi:MAG: hypothetical protein F9K24_16075 [Leptonema illini]|uniref:Uncharacterized protein n=1 Tax=Leptonema illini TaxID=183 RepID=A0A833GZG9_9LEPT|nr:MAG: hypothetical protein F9K24_16075 [Leptonema illini]
MPSWNSIASSAALKGLTLLVVAGAVKWFVPRLFVSSEEFEGCMLFAIVVEEPFMDYLVAAVPTGACLLVALFFCSVVWTRLAVACFTLASIIMHGLSLFSLSFSPLWLQVASPAVDAGVLALLVFLLRRFEAL